MKTIPLALFQLKSFKIVKLPYNNIDKNMNLIAQQLAKETSTQKLLIKFLDHLSEYFSKSSNNSQEKTYNLIQTFTDKVHQRFPEQNYLKNISYKLIAMVKMKVDDKFDDENCDALEKKQSDEKIGEMMKQFTRKSSMEQKTNKKRDVDEAWLKKLVIDQMASLKDDIKENQNLIEGQIAKTLKPYTCQLQMLRFLIRNNLLRSLDKTCETFNCLIFDSQLNNSLILHNCVKNGLKAFITKIDVSNQVKKPGVISLKQVSHNMRNFDVVIISGDSIMKNGAVLAESGSLMTAIAAKINNKPVLIVSRGFSLTDKFMIGQGTLTVHDNPLKYFDFGQEQANKIFIGKKYDLIEPSLIKSIITEFGACQPNNIWNFFEEFYEKI